MFPVAAVDYLRESGFVPPGPVYNEFIDPSHDEHLNADGERTVWTLRNAVTEVYKDCSVFTLPKRCASMHGILDARANVVDAIAGEFEVLAA